MSYTIEITKRETIEVPDRETYDQFGSSRRTSRAETRTSCVLRADVETLDLAAVIKAVYGYEVR
jgi:hypothetical protein